MINISNIVYKIYCYTYGKLGETVNDNTEGIGSVSIFAHFS